MCTKFAASLGFKSASIITINSEVATPSMYYKHRLDLKLFWQMDTGSKKKTNDLSIDVVDAMPAVHTQSGCDSTNSFSGIGKVKFFKTKCKDLRYYSAASMLGERDTKKKHSGRDIRGFVLPCLWDNSWDRYKLCSLYAVIKAEKGMKLFRLFLTHSRQCSISLPS